MARVSAEQRRKDLTLAAFRVMTRVGVSSATTRLIAEEAGVPQGVFHYAFRSKDELFRQLIYVVVEGMVGDALDAMVEGVSFQESLQRSLRQMWNNAITHPDCQLVLYELTAAALREPGGETLARWQYDQYFAFTKKLLLSLAEHTGVRWLAPVDVLSRMVSSMMDGLVLAWITDRNTEDSVAALDIFSSQLAKFAIIKDGDL
ncbi:TetR/AcrR family transcriptional regulator [Ochrobactrum sp. SFR4]|uniref:TetR/AcrR family transcriptional regulator n=1 Tax=Ochrobactrum sp. SFR4 TaxID=2717368 RepID=UPI001C8CDBC5|nr:TetR/AcrR family transcriptional regulator [Ochrobactrum sp. SFR4]MBX8827352.1 TetR/AcrR family transcriptional regulator [Ochrobactrum sp. SFR4]